jgi:hypothetical protein
MEQLEAAAFRRLLEHLRLREDASNIDLMGLAGFCRNCLADWLAEASVETPTPLTREEARTHVYGEPYAAFKARQPEATPEQIARMEASLARNAELRAAAESRKLDEGLIETFPASDPPAATSPS